MARQEEMSIVSIGKPSLSEMKETEKKVFYAQILTILLNEIKLKKANETIKNE